MTRPVDISPHHLKIVWKILRKNLPPGVAVWAFGSRADWTTKDSSDLDLALEWDSKLEYGVMSALENALEESDLPYAVDILDLNQISDSFRRIVGAQKTPLPTLDGRSSVVGWPRLRFGDCAKLAHDTASPTGLKDAPYVGLEHIGKGALSLVGCGAAKDAGSTVMRFQRGDILFGKPHPYLRRVARADFDGVCSTDIWAVRPTGGVDADFLLYVMASNEFVDAATRDSEGTRAPCAKWEQISQYEAPVPPLDGQRAAARVLRALDDRVELNLRANKTLEEMARVLFKSWFVDFDPVRAKADGRWLRGKPLPGLPAGYYNIFPDRLVDSDLGAIPEGWEVAVLDDVVEILSGGTPKTSVQDYWNGRIPWYTAKDAPSSDGVFALTAEMSITQTGVDNSSAKILPAGTTVISAQGTVGRMSCLGVPMAVSRTCYGVRGAGGYPDFFTYWNARKAVSGLRAMAHETIFDAVTLETFRITETVLVPTGAALAFESIIAPWMNRILGSLNESRAIVAQRDALLQKLVSGELRAGTAGALPEVLA